jgi:superfamily II DNA or RNA helicase
MGSSDSTLTPASPSSEHLRVRGFELAPWQQEAVKAWWCGDPRGPFRGTLEVFTGGGKTLIALACVERAARRTPTLQFAVVVPTQALARQWRDQVLRYTDINPTQIGQLGGGKRDTFGSKRALICVLNTAATRLPKLAEASEHLMLVIDECHRAGAPTFSRVLSTRAEYRLGLSATPDREELDEHGEPLSYDEHALGQKLGEVVYRFSLKDAREAGWLPDYTIHHHGVQLHEDERAQYESLSRRVDELADALGRFGVDTSRARSLSARNDELGRTAQAYVAATSSRKDLLYRARERARAALRIVVNTTRRATSPRALLFHERIEEAQALYESLRASCPTLGIAIEHSRLPASQRELAVAAFRDGTADVLVSVKSLIEGIDVPDADVGISVASSSSVRQRVQSLGRVLRRGRSARPKHAEMHLIYVADSVDEVIYSKEDWADLTGPGANHYWIWPLDPALEPEARSSPPLTPAPTEDQEWERLGRIPPIEPVPYFGALPAREYSVDTRGTVRNAQDEVIANPQDVAGMVRSVRGEPGGRFYVTPAYRIVVVRKIEDGRSTLYAAGVLREPFAVRPLGGRGSADIDVGNLRPGSAYPGPTTKTRGTFSVRQKAGGKIERKLRGGVREFALDGGDEPLHVNARRLLDAWKHVSGAGFSFFVNDLWHAWYLEAGEPRFLAVVEGCFRFPSDETRE